MSSDPIRAALERLVDAVDGRRWDAKERQDAIVAALAALAASPATDEPAVPQEGREPAAVAPKASALIARVARMADRIGQHTIGEIVEISDQAAAWLQENPPGQSTAPPAPVEGEVGELVEWLDDQATHLRRMESIGALPEGELPEQLARASYLLQQQSAELAALRTRATLVPVGGEVGELVQHLEQAAENAAAMGHGLDSWAIATGAWLIRRWSTGAGCFHTGAMPHPYQPPQGGEVEG